MKRNVIQESRRELHLACAADLQDNLANLSIVFKLKDRSRV